MEQSPYRFLEQYRVHRTQDFDRFLRKLAEYKLLLLEKLATLERQEDVRFLQGRIYEINQILRIFTDYAGGKINGRDSTG